MFSVFTEVLSIELIDITPEVSITSDHFYIKYFTVVRRFFLITDVQTLLFREYFIDTHVLYLQHYLKNVHFFNFLYCWCVYYEMRWYYVITSARFGDIHHLSPNLFTSCAFTYHHINLKKNLGFDILLSLNKSKKFF